MGRPNSNCHDVVTILAGFEFSRRRESLNGMKTFMTGIVGALVGAACVLAFLYLKPPRKLYMVFRVDRAIEISTGPFFTKKAQCEAFVEGQTRLKCEAVDYDTAVISGLSAALHIEANCDCAQNSTSPLARTAARTRGAHTRR